MISENQIEKKSNPDRISGLTGGRRQPAEQPDPYRLVHRGQSFLAHVRPLHRVLRTVARVGGNRVLPVGFHGAVQQIRKLVRAGEFAVKQSAQVRVQSI